MSPSSDIETLFGHFGGNASDYQEIGRENEASTARTRWPLLVTLDLTQPSIPAIVQRRDAASKQSDDAAQARAAEDDMPEASVSADTPLTGPALMRSKAPLFARPHRRNIPPVANVVKADGPRGAERFSALPQVADPQVAASQTAAPVAAAEAVAPAASIPTVPPIPPVVASTAPGFASIAHMGNVPPVVAPATAHAVPSQPSSVAPALRAFAPPAAPLFSAKFAGAGVSRVPTTSSSFTAGTPRAAVAAPAPTPAPAVATAQPGSILGKLFKPAAHNPASATATPAPQNTAAPLASVFDRLRGEAPAAATPAPHSWLTNGPRRS
jgi:hypothetical protein